MLREVKREMENNICVAMEVLQSFFLFLNQSCYVHGQTLTNRVTQALSLSKLLSRFLLNVLLVPPHLNFNISNI